MCFQLTCADIVKGVMSLFRCFGDISLETQKVLNMKSCEWFSIVLYLNSWIRLYMLSPCDTILVDLVSREFGLMVLAVGQRNSN